MILAINCGSSSIKAALFELDTLHQHLRLQVNHIGEKVSTLQNNEHTVEVGQLDFSSAFLQLCSEIKKYLKANSQHMTTVCHRIPHGGHLLKNPTLIDTAIETKIEELSKLAPLHNPISLAAIRCARKEFKLCRHIGMFDTDYYTRLPQKASSYALPCELVAKYNIRRYGFHGISHQFVNLLAAQFLNAPLDDSRTISLHLGNGCSVTATHNGCCVETSMGMTPLEGLVMGSRCGDVDPGILIQLLREECLSVTELDKALNQRSGLLGMTGTNNMAEIEKNADSGDSTASNAIDVFCHRTRKYIGAYTAVMGGLDNIIFTGGIGENSARVRHEIAKDFAYLGAHLNATLNQQACVNHEHPVIEVSSPCSRVRILVIATNEELAMAKETNQWIQNNNCNKKY